MRPAARRSRVVAMLLAVGLAAAGAAGAAPPDRAPGWTSLASVPPGVKIVVATSDGRQFTRTMVRTEADALIVADLDRLTSKSRRHEIQRSIAANPTAFSPAAVVEQDGTRVAVIERLDRLAIVLVARPKPWTLEPGPLAWLLAYAGACPNCDVAQTWPAGVTVLPSPLKASAPGGQAFGDILYAAPHAAAVNALDAPTWQQLREWLPSSLKGK
jgi:hypothetical protein